MFLKIINVKKRTTQIPRKEIDYKMIFRPEHAEDIGYVCVVNQIFESVSDLFA